MENKFHVSNHQPVAIAKQEKLHGCENINRKAGSTKKKLFAKMQKKRGNLADLNPTRRLSFDCTLLYPMNIIGQ